MNGIPQTLQSGLLYTLDKYPYKQHVVHVILKTSWLQENLMHQRTKNRFTPRHLVKELDWHEQCRWCTSVKYLWVNESMSQCVNEPMSQWVNELVQLIKP